PRPLRHRGSRGRGGARPSPSLRRGHRGAGGRPRQADRPPGVGPRDRDPRLRGRRGAGGGPARGREPAGGGGGGGPARRRAPRSGAHPRAPAPGAAALLPAAHAAPADDHSRGDGGLVASSSTRSRQLAEFLGLSSFALALMLLISLATYNPGDPAPFFKAGATGPARNF